MAKPKTPKKPPSARSTVRHDPVEDAKMEVDNEELPEAPESPAEATATPVEPEPPPAPGKPPPKDPPKAKRLPLYQVEETCYAQIGGMRHRLKQGKRIDSESYGLKQIESMREQGVKLREIERAS